MSNETITLTKAQLKRVVEDAVSLALETATPTRGMVKDFLAKEVKPRKPKKPAKNAYKMVDIIAEGDDYIVKQHDGNGKLKEKIIPMSILWGWVNNEFRLSCNGAQPVQIVHDENNVYLVNEASQQSKKSWLAYTTDSTPRFALKAYEAFTVFVAKVLKKNNVLA